MTIKGLVWFLRICCKNVAEVSAVQFSVTSMTSTSPVSKQMPE